MSNSETLSLFRGRSKRYPAHRSPFSLCTNSQDMKETMTNTRAFSFTSPPSRSLGDQLRDLAVWAEFCPPEHRTQVSQQVEKLALLLGHVVGETEREV
jgi:hypothetical protein